MRGLLLNAEWERIAEQFEQRKIIAVSFKGPAQVRYLYPDREVRMFGDLDFVVQPVDLSSARELLRSLGYAAHYGENAFVQSVRSARVTQALWVHKTHCASLD